MGMAFLFYQRYRSLAAATTNYCVLLKYIQEHGYFMQSILQAILHIIHIISVVHLCLGYRD